MNSDPNMNQENNKDIEVEVTQSSRDIYVESIQRDIPKTNETEAVKTETSNTVDDINVAKSETLNQLAKATVATSNNVEEEDVVESTTTHAKKKHKLLRYFTKIVAGAAVFGLVAGSVFVGIDHNATQKQIAANKTAEEVQEENTITPTQTSTSDQSYTGVSQIVENVKPSIVAITSTSKAVAYDFFGRPSIQEASGAGSGIIIGQNDDELLIATNNHVIDGATSIVIQFNDETTAKATVKGAEPTSDLAVVAVDLNDLEKDTLSKIKVASLGNSDDCKQGELVIAIGNALGYGQSTTVGYISALDREVTVDDVTLSLLQTDAAINPGNSGGALLNAKGEVIGINSVKYVETEVEGIGYAIPISTAVPIINDLMNRQVLGEHQKAYLGIGGSDVTEEDSKALNIPVGVYVNKVENGSPADVAGLKSGDIITAVNGRSVDTVEKLQNYLNYTKAGSTVTFTLSRSVDGSYSEQKVEVTLGNRK